MVERPIRDESFWSPNPNAQQQDWAGYLGLDAPDDEASGPTDRATAEEPVSLQPAPAASAAPEIPSLDAPDGFAALTAPNDDLLPRR